MDESSDESSSWTRREVSSLWQTFTLEESTNVFIMQLNNALKILTPFSRVHSIISPFWTVEYWGHWTHHDDIQVTRWDLIMVSIRWTQDNCLESLQYSVLYYIF